MGSTIKNTGDPSLYLESFLCRGGVSPQVASRWRPPELLSPGAARASGQYARGLCNVLVATTWLLPRWSLHESWTMSPRLHTLLGWPAGCRTV